jgi:Ca2+-dependent lipid-binding protein
VILELWEDDALTSDDHLGSVVIDIEELLSKKPNENKYILKNASGENIGEV